MRRVMKTQMAQIKVVYGAPCSGKSTYVRENIKDNDVRFDYDLVLQAISNKKSHEYSEKHRPYVIECREKIINKASDDDSIDIAYITTCKISDKLKSELDGLDVEYVLMDKTKEECYELLDGDETREDKEFWKTLIDEWFEWYEEYTQTEEEEEEEEEEQSFGKVVETLREQKNQREIRAIPIDLEVRATEEGDKRTIAGAIKYNTESAEMRDWWGDTFVEEISAGAFDDSLKERDVVGLWSHDTGQVLGNTKSGTLRIDNDKKALRFELDIPDTSAGNDAWALIQRGDVDGVSFGMKVTKDKWSSENRGEKKIYKRSILSAELYEISPVAFPAYPANEVSCRSLDEFKESEKRKLDEELIKRKLKLELELL